MCSLLNHEKLPYQFKLFGGKILYLAAFIQFGANMCGKNLLLYFKGKIKFLGANFLVERNLKSLILK